MDLKTLANNESFPVFVGFPKNRTVNNSNLLTVNSNCHQGETTSLVRDK